MYIWNNIGEKWGLSYQEEATPIMVGIRDLHDKIMYYLIIIVIIVSYMSIVLYKNKKISIKYYNNSTWIELVWTLIPAVILYIIAIPSFKLLYNIDEILKPVITLKIKGLQWYWNYSIRDSEKEINFDSYTKSVADLEKGELRLLDVDNTVKLPILRSIRLLVTADDVIHSFALPAMGIKIDSIPGRLNQGMIFILKEGKYYGQCSELCGKNHSNMSIVIEGVSDLEYLNWLYNYDN